MDNYTTKVGAQRSRHYLERAGQDDIFKIEIQIYLNTTLIQIEFAQSVESVTKVSQVLANKIRKNNKIIYNYHENNIDYGKVNMIIQK